MVLVKDLFTLIACYVESFDNDEFDDDGVSELMWSLLLGDLGRG